MPLEAHTALGTEGCDTFQALTPSSESLVTFSSRRARWKQADSGKEDAALKPAQLCGVGRRTSWNLKKKQEGCNTGKDGTNHGKTVALETQTPASPPQAWLKSPRPPHSIFLLCKMRLRLFVFQHSVRHHM